jgi:kynurenine formamidase
VTGFQELGTKLRNWGRWGTDDELGTVNFITAASRLRGAQAARSGQVVQLGMPFDANGPQSGGLRFNPIHRKSMLLSDGEFGGMAVADDIVIMPLQSATQWDSLAHVGYGSRAYNDVPYSAVTAVQGATRNSFDKVNLNLESGDIVCVRTGWYQHFLARDAATYMAEPHPGLGLSCAQWLYDNQAAVIACDNFAVECRPSRDPDAGLPFHMVAIRDMGLQLGEMFNLEDLAAACAERDAWDFLFAGPGLKITGSVGSPVSPVAVL